MGTAGSSAGGQGEQQVWDPACGSGGFLVLSQDLLTGYLRSVASRPQGAGPRLVRPRPSALVYLDGSAVPTSPSGLCQLVAAIGVLALVLALAGALVVVPVRWPALAPGLTLALALLVVALPPAWRAGREQLRQYRTARRARVRAR